MYVLGFGKFHQKIRSRLEQHNQLWMISCNWIGIKFETHHNRQTLDQPISPEGEVFANEPLKEALRPILKPKKHKSAKLDNPLLPPPIPTFYPSVPQAAAFRPDLRPQNPVPVSNPIQHPVVETPAPVQASASQPPPAQASTSHNPTQGSSDGINVVTADQPEAQPVAGGI